MQGISQYSRIDILLTCLGLLFLLADIVLDALAVVSFYQAGEYVGLGLLLLFLVGSSLVVQIYSWLWYYYDNFDRVTKVESCLSVTMLKVLHVFQLGIYLRHAGVFEVTICHLIRDSCLPKEKTAFLSHDLSLLRLIETFTESAPQLVLMVITMVQAGRLDAFKVLKAVGSASAMACSMVMYHRALRSFLPDKNKQRISSSVVFFLWNLLLLAPRLAALALFASVLPYFFILHLGVSWVVLFLFAWKAKTDFMDGPAGEWLFRATVGLIWYFSWFSVVEGRTRYKSLLYHLYILGDLVLLCGLWCWRMNTSPPDDGVPLLHAIIAGGCIVAVYVLGLLVKLTYYRLFHPNLSAKEGQARTGADVSNGEELTQMCAVALPDEVDGVGLRSTSVPTEPEGNRAQPVRRHKRMMKLADNFYS